MRTSGVRSAALALALISAVAAGTSVRKCEAAEDGVPGQWSTNDTSKPENIQWPSSWIGAKNLRAQWFKIFADHPDTWKWEHHAKGEPPTSTYFLWRMDKPVPEGTKLLLEGDFPHARFFSLQIGAPWTKEQPALGDGSGIPEVPLLDEDIEPDPGNVNPFRAGADRNAVKRHYHVTFELRDGNAAQLKPRAMIPPYRAPGNQRIGGTRTGKSGEYGPYLWVRIYLPDRYEPYCGVEPPVLRIQYPGKKPELAPIVRRINLNVGRFLPDFTREENPARADGFSVKELEVNDFLENYARKGNEAAGPPLANFSEARLRYMTNRDGTVAINKSFTTFRYIYSRRPPPEKYGSLSKEEWLYGQLPKIIKYYFGMGPDMPPPGNDEHNSDHNDFATYLTGAVMMPPGQCLVISGTLPKTPKTLAGNPIAEPSDELRYFGLLLQSGEPLPITPVVAVHDEQLVLDKDRHYTLVVSTKADRPKNATPENGFTWREWPVGSRLSMLIRMVSTNPNTWRFAPQHISWDVCDLTSRRYDPYHVQKHMQQYAPVGRYLSKESVERLQSAGDAPFSVPPTIPLTEANRFLRSSTSAQPAQQSESKPTPATTAPTARTAAPLGPARPTAPMETSAGPIIGEERGGIRSFKAIPYAAPPVGELRWKPPVAPKPWTAPLTCVKYGPACPQSGSDLFGDVGEMSEDCLTLNVWTAAKSPREKQPVMVWIHGGGFMIGSSGKTIYDGTALARKGIVFVSVNYRLGPFGFFAHPALSAESPHRVSGNYGIMDQIFALQWIRANIEKFGGDPGNVTIFGQSAGGVSVCALMCSPLAKGLIHRGIAESGAPPAGLRSLRRDAPRLGSGESLGLGLAERLGVGSSPNALEAMRAKPWQEILKAVKPGSGMAGGGTTDHLIVDGYVLTEPPGRTFQAHRQMPIPFLAGTVADEGTVFLRKMRSTNLAACNAFFDKTLGPLAARAKPLYPAEDDGAARRAMADFVGDGFVSGVRMAVRASAAVQPKTFLYQFTRMTRPMAGSDLGCFHGAEIPYVFGVLSPEKGYGEDDQRLSEVVMGCWVRFAQCGDPNGGGVPTWPAYTEMTDQHLILDLEPRVGSHLRQKTCDFFDAMQPR